MATSDDLTPFALRGMLRTLMAYTMGLEELLVRRGVLQKDELQAILPAWHVQADVIIEKLLAAERAEVTTDGEERSTEAAGGGGEGPGGGGGDPDSSGNAGT